ncbi:uncharacterized protein [Halyomorpha halys]|uniref:uncharacterized protein isoform X1 n=1 Tax=Halyomorpha halys TaxID=286706 RepID=UPI0006D4EA0A|nr:uncharacterized protein LOC106677796 [Halyomorpha halys]
MIQTYVILDLETTGLPSTNYGDTKITELSLISVSRKHFDNISVRCIPRVLNKLTMCFHPQRFIAEESKRITGLSNELLESQRTFDVKVCEILENFIMGEPQPVCLLAHNGYRFDFPLLQAHTKILGKPLPDTVLCSDTLHAFRELQILEKPPPWQIPQEVIQPYTPPHQEDDEWITNSSTEICRVIDELEKSVLNDDIHLSLDYVYGKTPEKKRLPREDPPPRRRESVPQGPTPIPSKVRRNLFGSPVKKPSYRLENVYQHLLKKKISNAHSAEGDSYAILECISAIGPPFHNWVLTNHRKLSSILKLW